MTEPTCPVMNCGRRMESSGHCICHSPDRFKDREKFWREVEKVLQDEKTGQYNFNGFIFVPQIGKQISDYFEKYEFTKPVNFSEAQLDYPLTFSETKFRKPAYFTKARFNTIVSFHKAEFEEAADFNLAKFEHPARFSNAKFTVALFSSTVFSRAADFEQAEFKKEARFNVITFNGRANFAEANFDEKADFSATHFKSVTFSEAKFKSADFKQTTFDSEANFCDTAFKTVHFNNATFQEGADWTRAQFDTRASFERVTFLMPQTVRFHHTDLRFASFAFTDLRRVDFLNPTWALAKDPFMPGIGRVAVYDEKEIEKYGEDYYKVVETIYRQLKHNYEEKRNYPEAGDFYIGEMEMRRLNPKIAWLERQLLTLYRWLSLYGEDYRLAFIWICALALLSGAAMLLTGFTLDYGSFKATVPHHEIALGFPELGDVLTSLLVALKLVTFQREGIVPLSRAGVFVQTITSVFGLFLLAIFGLALRRRFRR